MSRTILLADDSLTIQKVVELTFADTEYEVVAVSSGDELLQRLPETRPDLVICDVIMPGRDGYDVCKEIKSSSEFLHLPVILLTGTFEPFDRDRAIAVGCSEIITKPFEAKKLVDAVERLTATPAAPPPSAAEDFAAMIETEEVEAISLDDEPVLDEEPFIDAGTEDEPFPSENEIVEERPLDGADIDSSLTTPIDVEAVMAQHQPEVVEEPMVENVEEPPNDAPDDADTQDFGDKPPAQQAPEEVSGIGLSDEDIDRIARRLLELSTDRIEHIAWDVIPDMAEVVVRERMRELEAEAEREPS